MILISTFRSFVTFFFMLTTAILLQGCGEPADASEGTKPLKRQNFVVLLDLSDRLLTEAQVQNDLEVIKQVMDAFVQTAKSKLYIASHDRLKIVIAPQDKSPVSAQAFHKTLYLDMAQVPLKGIHPTKYIFLAAVASPTFVEKTKDGTARRYATPGGRV